MNFSQMISTEVRQWQTPYGPVQGQWVDLSNQSFPLGFFDNLAKEILTIREKAKFDSYPLHGKRQREWLTGRLASKKLIADWVFTHGSKKLSFQDIEIISDDKGRPSFAIDENPGPHPSLSLSHSGPKAVAVLAPTLHHKIGVDLESLDIHSPGKWMERAFAKEELKAFDTQNELMILALWAAKEAVGKALGTGLGGNPMNFFAKPSINSKNKIMIEHKKKEFVVDLHFEKRDIMALCLF